MKEINIWMERWAWTYPILILTWVYGNYYLYWLSVVACVVFWIRTLIEEGKTAKKESG